MGRVPGIKSPKPKRFTLQDMIKAYMCGYGDRDAKLHPFVGSEPAEYINLIKEGLV